MNLERLLTAMPAVVCGMFGVAACFAGRRLLKGLLVAAGGILGMGLVLLGAAAAGVHRILWLLLLAAIGAAIGTALFARLYKLSVFAVGAACGVLLAPPLLNVLGIGAGPLATAFLIMLCGACCGLIALLAERAVIVGFTAVVGAFATVMAGVALGSGNGACDADAVLRAHAAATGPLWWTVALLIAAGAVVQWRERKRPR